MKALKIIAVVLGGVLLLAVLIIGVALVPAVQTWAVRKAVARQPGLTVEVGRVAVGFSAADIRELRLVKDGTIISARQISASYSAWDYLRQKKISVGRVAATGLLIDTRQAVRAARGAGGSPAAAATGQNLPVAFGLLQLPRLPVDVRLDQITIDGRLLLPGERAVSFNLQGGGVAVGQLGKLDWKVDFSDPAKDVPLRALHATGSLRLQIAPDRRISVVEVETIAAADGPRLPTDRIRFDLKAEQPTTTGRAVCTAQVSLVRQDRTEPVFNLLVDFAPPAGELHGAWDVAIRSEQLAALLAGFGLPELAVNGAGKFSCELATGAAAANGEISGRVSAWEKLGAQFAAVGPIGIHAAFDGGWSDNVARLSRLEIEFATQDDRKLLQIVTTQPVSFNVADKRLKLTKSGGDLAQVVLAGLPLAWAQPLVKPLTIDSGELSGTLAVEAEPDGSRAHVRTIKPLTLSHTTFRDGPRKLVDQMTLSLSPNIAYSAEKITAEIPDLALTLPAGDTLNGRMNVEITNLSATPVVGFSAEFQERLVSVLRPFLSTDPGPLAVSSNAEGQLEGQTLRLAKFVSSVARDNGALVAAIETLQPVTADFVTVRVAASDPAAPAVRLRIGAVPLTLIEAFAPKCQVAGTLTGGTLEIALPAKDEITMQTKAPVTLRGVDVAWAGQPLGQALDVNAEINITKRGAAVAGELRPFELKQGATTLVKIDAAGEYKPGDKLTASGKGQITADLAALMKQPVFAMSALLARGEASANFDVTIADAVQAKIAVAAHHLVARQGNQSLGDLDVSVEATAKPDGSGGIVKLPIALAVEGRRSDLLFDGSFDRTPALLTLNGKLTSIRLITGDFQALAALAPQVTASSAPAAPAAPAAATPRAAGSQGPSAQPVVAAAAARDSEPFWKGIAGKFEADLREVEYGHESVISGVRCTATVNDTRLAIDHLEGKTKDQSLLATAGISFTAGQTEPYSLSGQVSLPGFDVGAFLRAANPNDPPALESTVAISAKLDGRGATLPDLLEKTYGQFDVTGTKGVLRALGNKQGQVASLASGALRLFGAIQGSDTAVAVGDLTAKLKEMPFDQISMHVDRGEDLTLKMTTLELISPDTRLTGSGSVTYQKGVPVANQPLHVELVLAGKEGMGLVLNRLHLLSGQQDDKGYYPMASQFVVGGTPAKPDSKQLWSIVTQAAAGSLFR